MNEFFHSRLGLLCFLLTAVLLHRFFGWLSDWQERETAKDRARIHKKLTGEDRPWESFIYHD